MTRSPRLVLVLGVTALAALSAACPSTGTTEETTSSSGGNGGSSGASGNASSGGSTGGSSGTSGTSGASGGATSSSSSSSSSSGNIIRQPDATASNNTQRDSDCDGLTDEQEFSRTYAGGAKTDPANPDSDGDGIFDGIEAGATSIVSADAAACGPYNGDADPTTTTNPASRDTDGDGIEDGDEDRNTNGRVDDGETDPTDLDSDGDGLPDALEDTNHDGVRTADETSAALRDTDGDGIPDGIEDVNHDGIKQATETDPRVADTDNDGLSDGQEDPNWNHVVDAGETDPLSADTDTDMDGIPDGRENQIGFDPNNPDMDNDGLNDGQEDRNRNGVVDANETNPRRPDSDCDGLKDGEEDLDKDATLDANETDPLARDSDGDLIPDGVERGITTNPDPTFCPSFMGDTNPATTTNPRAADSDNDGLNDGIEDRNRNGAVDSGELDPNNPDMDNDGILDGAEDRNGNGIVDVGETDPRVSDRDGDSDGLTDAVEARLGTSPTNPDTDGDLVPDGMEDRNHDGARALDEMNPLSRDTDCDGVADGDEDANKNGIRDNGELDPLNKDSDGDGLFDGVEMGRTVNLDAQRCTAFVADADPAAGTNTDPLDNDSDNDGVPDGTEDANQNGRVDSGELNPNNNMDATPTDLAACATQNLKPVTIISRPDGTADLLLAVSPDYSVVTELVHNGDKKGAMVFNPTLQIAGFAFKVSPGLSGANVNAQLATFESRLASAGNQQDKTARNITRWDGFPAVLASYTYTDAGNNAVAQAANDLVAAVLGSAPTGLLAPGAGSDVGPYRLQVEVVRRSANTTMVVGALVNMAQWTTTQARAFSLDDMTNGSPLAQFGDSTGVQCDRMTVQARQKVDFIWVVDNSGSMDNEQTALSLASTAFTAQLNSSTVDWRVAAVTSDLDRNGNTLDQEDDFNNAPGGWRTYEYPDQDARQCDYGGTAYPIGPRFCSFTTNAATFSGCIDDMSICGSGSEHFFRPVACLMALDTNQAARVGGKWHCGRNGGTQGRPTPTDGNGDNFPDGYDDGYHPPPSPYAMLPRAAADVHKIRTGARVAFIFLTDANEQSDGRFTSDSSALALSTIPRWAQFFQNFDGLGTPESSAFVGGIVCPAGAGCTDEMGNYMNTRWPTFASNMPGSVFADLPGDGTPDQAGRISTAIANILNAAIGDSSPYVLTKPPISSTIKVATEALTEGACTTTDVPRSRQHGWDYNPTTRAIVFYGNCRPRATETGKRISVSYRYWVDQSPNPDGNAGSCGVCTPPLVCNPATLQCECPADCGMGGGCGSPRVCDTSPGVCACACPADCGGSPSNPRFTCDTASCSFVCPSDCGGPSPGPGFSCNTTTCQYECNGCQGTRPSAQYQCDLTTCQWACPSDCGASSPGPSYRCDPTSCSYVCTADCGGTCTGTQVCNATSCGCECSQNVTCGAGLRFDATACACVCDTAALNCGPTRAPNAATCTCDCQPNCNGVCTGAEVCQPSLCICETIGG